MKDKKYSKRFGAWGETFAANYLKDQGVNIIGKNVHTPYGELDLIGIDGTCYVVFEVKTRSSEIFGNPEDSISTSKSKHIIAAAQYYFQENNLLDVSWRIDVIALQKKSLKTPQIVWFKDMIREE